MSIKLTKLNEKYENRENYDDLKYVARAALDHAELLERLLRDACRMIGGDELDARQEAFITKCDEVLL